MPLLFFLLACAEPDPAALPTDSGAEEVPEKSDAPLCDALELEVDGPQPPVVGDEWAVWLFCDGSLLTGTMVLRFDPPDVASTDSNHATFVAAGEATMRMQVGSMRVEEELTVGE